jgi:hypothetical protein
MEAAIAHTHGNEIVRDAAALFIGHAESLLEQGGPMVLICAPPKELLAAVDEPPSRRPDPSEQELDEGSDSPQADRRHLIPFHDVLKAEGLRLGIPIQMVRPYTYTGERTRKKTNGVQPSDAPMQDEATRAWNLHTALYYKAGGVPWRLLRNSTDLSTCFVGISFYKSLDGDRLLTSVAQVFNERGEGVIVKGAQAQLSKDDRQPHLAEGDAQSLLTDAVAVYRKEHRTMPARLVVHKTSKMTEGEIIGFRAASEESKVDVVELLSLRRSFTRVFRAGTYPPLRGTFSTFNTELESYTCEGVSNFSRRIRGCTFRGRSNSLSRVRKLLWSNSPRSFCGCPSSIGTTRSSMAASQSPYERLDASETSSNVSARANASNQVSDSICNTTTVRL